MTSPLIPTPVVDKNGRLTTVHRRGLARNSNGGKFPEPRNEPSYTVTEVDLGELGKLISSDQTREAWAKMPLVDQDVLSRVLALTESDELWRSLVTMELNLVLMGRQSAPYIEARMRRILTVAPLVGRVESMNQLYVRDIHRYMNAAFVMQTRFHEDSGVGSVEDWDADSDIKALGCLIATAASTSSVLTTGYHRDTFFEGDAVWLGTHSEQIIPLMPTIVERGIYTRADIEPLVKSAAPALTEGML